MSGKNDLPEIAKILSVFGFVIILFSLCVIGQNPGIQGYEISVYEEYPTYVWFLIILDIYIFQIIIFFCAYYNISSNFLWIIAYIGIIYANSILLLIPIIRHYAIYGLGDPLTHMGYMLDILQTGHLNNNIYPIAHIIGVISSLICGFNLSISMQAYPVIYYIFSAICLYLLLKTILNHRSSILIGMMLTALMFAGHGNISFSPQSLSNYLIPFIFFLYFSRFFKRKAFNFGILTIISSILITFSHPLTTIFLIISFSIHDCVHRVFKCTDFCSEFNKRSSLSLILILIIIFLIWQSYAYFLLGTIIRIYTWLNDEAVGSSNLEIFSDQISEFAPSMIFILKSLIYIYGIYFMFMFMAIISIFVLVRKLKNGKYHANIYVITTSTIFAFCFLSYISSQFLINETGYGRLGHYAVLLSIFLISMALGDILKKQKERMCSQKLLLISFLILLIFIDYLSVFTLYLSPITKSPGQHVTYSELIGFGTFFEKRSEELQIMEGGMSVSRIKDALYGRSKTLTNVKYRITAIPPHFSYTYLNCFGDYYNEPVYLAINTLFRISLPKIIPDYPERWRFNRTDFAELENDKSVSKIYSNRQLDIYLLNSIRKEGILG